MITIELIPDLEEGGFTARIPDIAAYGEGETEDEAIADLKGCICVPILSRQYAAVVASHNTVRDLRDRRQAK